MRVKRFLSLCLALLVSVSIIFPAQAADISTILNDTATYLLKTVKDPQVGSIGGEWAVLGLARSGYSVPKSYYGEYYQNVISYVSKRDGVLHKRKYTEYSRVILALTAIGKDPTNVGGYDLVAPLGDYDKTVWQGINGGIFALIALDSGNYALPEGSTASREKYVNYILDHEIDGGGWSLTGDVADVDVTAMALQALSKYQDRTGVREATERALTWLSKSQKSDGTFATYDVYNCESCAQVVVALCELGIKLDDSRFVKNGNTALDGLMKFYVKGSGFTHVAGGGNGVDGMSTEQGFYALVAADRAAKGESSLYRMSEKKPASFTDVDGHKNQKAIDALVERKIINGMGNGLFAPNETMTRAQFCSIVVKALGITPAYTGIFTDVDAGKWYADYVDAAYKAGIVTGVGDNKFSPEGTITRQEAAVMVARAARVLGLDTSTDNADVVLNRFADSDKTASWAKDSMAYCCQSGILDAGSELRPTKAILRCEIAQMIYNTLKLAGKL